MNQQHRPDDTLLAELESLGRVFEAEERADRRAEAQRRREGLPAPSAGHQGVPRLRERRSGSLRLTGRSVREC